VSALKDITDQRFGKLVVVARAQNGNDRRAKWLCICDCRRETIVSGSKLRVGETQSCGCLRRNTRDDVRKRRTVHGQSATPEYRAWGDAKKRVRNPIVRDWHRYGGRGIRMCDRWMYGENGCSGFECFIKDMGPRPSSKHSLDRWPDPDGNYEPTNCRWATACEQANNRSDYRRISSGVALLTIAEYVCDVAGFSMVVVAR
jgi:hypothetical protein